jgi:hypothetical protein
MPGSSLPDIVISPDLSNLPRGSTAIDTDTGEEFHGAEDPKDPKDRQDPRGRDDRCNIALDLLGTTPGPFDPRGYLRKGPCPAFPRSGAPSVRRYRRLVTAA